MTEQEQKAIKWMKNVRDDAVVTLDHIAKEEQNVSPMLYAGRKEKAETIINRFEELEKYRAIGTVEELQKAENEEDILKFYYCDSEDSYLVGLRIGNYYYAHYIDGRWVFDMSRHLPWGEHVVDDTSAWKEHTYPSEPKEINFSEWLNGFIKKECGGTPEECRETMKQMRGKNMKNSQELGHQSKIDDKGHTSKKYGKGRKDFHSVAGSPYDRGYILTDIPDSCEECDYARLINGKTACTASNLRRQTEKEKPEWCPIRPIPEREDNDNLMDEYQDGYDDGWNACINAIGGGDDGTA